MDDVNNKLETISFMYMCLCRFTCLFVNIKLFTIYHVTL